MPRKVDARAGKPLLWVLREDLDIVGPQYHCGVASCGACTVHVDGQAVRSCSHPVSAFAGRSIVTIKGLLQDVKGQFRVETSTNCRSC
jgi:isoquinoline 1-oxidoreductase alpha subunit